MFQILLANGAEPSKVPILFEANQGQAPSSVRFLVRTTSYQMFLEEETVRIAIDGQCLTVTLPGALRPAKLAAVDPLQVRTDYLTGNNPSAWRHNVSNYRSVRRESVYQGIDLIFHSNAERVEYDFVVKPGANPGAIRMSIKGGERLRIDTRGRLVAKIGNAEFIQQAPVAYQLDSAGRREPVSARWVLAGARIARFETGPYDRRRTLIVDPEIEAAGVIGGVGKDEWTGLVRSGPQVIAVGVTESLTFPGAYGRRGRNITVAQLDANTLQLQRITYIGGSGTDRPLAATLIAPFLLRIVGQTDSRDFPIVNRQNSRILQPPYGGGPSDGFVCDFNLFLLQDFFSGSIFFSTYLGGSGEDRITAAGGSLIAGETRSTDLPTAIRGSYSAGWDVFWAQLDTFSDSFYGGYFGGSGDERVRGIALVDQFAFLAGSTTSPDLALENAIPTQRATRRIHNFDSLSRSSRWSADGDFLLWRVGRRRDYKHDSIWDQPDPSGWDNLLA